MNGEGWIKIHYKILEWEWMDDPYIVTLWLRILLNANVKDKKWHGRTIKRGQWFTSIHSLAEQTGWSRNTIKRILRILEQSNQIKTEDDAKGTLITVVNFGKYQDKRGSNADPHADPHADPNIRSKEDKKLINQENINSHTPRTREEKYAPLNANDVAFADFYKKTFRTEFLWQENTSEAVQRIADSIADKISEGGGESDPAEMPDNITKFLEAVYRLGDQWLNERFTPSLLAKQFNQLYQRIISATNGNKRTGNNKRGGNAPNPYGVSDEFLEDLARQLGGGV